MQNAEIEIIKNAIDLKEQLGFKRISPKKINSSNVDGNSWLSIRMDSTNRVSLAFGLDGKQLKEHGWHGDKIRTNIDSNGRVVIFEFDPEGDYAISGEKGSKRLECKITWREDICKKPISKNRYEIKYIPMNSGGVKRLAVCLPEELMLV